jgi:hypothetical protein
MKTSETINELAAALAKAQAELNSAKKDSRGHGYNYSDLASVIEEARKVLPKHGLSFSQLVGDGDGDRVSVNTILLHSSGQFISSEATIKIPDMRGVNDTQKAGAGLSYLRRYSLQAILGMASEDNDASTDSRPIVDVKCISSIAEVAGQQTSAALNTPPKLTEVQAKNTSKAPSFSRNNTASKSNDLGI